MLNYVWLFLIVLAIIIGGFTGKITNVTQAAFSGAETAVNIAIGLIGIMALWLGIMRIAHEAGLVRLLAKAIEPISKRLFPEIPPDHPAMGAMVLNISANWLGLSNAATPLGLKAMEELQTLNPQKDTATNSMIMFLALNTASITLIPTTIIAVRVQAGSINPTEIIGTTIFASACATVAAILATKTIEILYGGFSALVEKIKEKLKSIAITILATIALIILFKVGVFNQLFGLLPSGIFKKIINLASIWAIPLLLFIIPVLAFYKKIKIYEVFVEGAKEGFEIAVKIIPFLVAILVAIAMFRASGAMDMFVYIFSPVTNLIGMPAEILPAVLMRPLSGSGTLGIATELITTHGPDSFIGRLASTVYGCTETTFYVIAVYFGSVQIKKTRHAVPAGLIADAAGALAAVYICRVLFL